MRGLEKLVQLGVEFIGQGHGPTGVKGFPMTGGAQRRMEMIEERHGPSLISGKRRPEPLEVG